MEKVYDISNQNAIKGIPIGIEQLYSSCYTLSKRLQQPKKTDQSIIILISNITLLSLDYIIIIMML